MGGLVWRSNDGKIVAAGTSQFNTDNSKAYVRSISQPITRTERQLDFSERTRRKNKEKNRAGGPAPALANSSTHPAQEGQMDQSRTGYCKWSKRERRLCISGDAARELLPNDGQSQGYSGRKVGSEDVWDRAPCACVAIRPNYCPSAEPIGNDKGRWAQRSRYASFALSFYEHENSEVDKQEATSYAPQKAARICRSFCDPLHSLNWTIQEACLNTLAFSNSAAEL